MNPYYLIAQLPSLDGIGDSMPLPITEERFAELCERLLGKKARNAFEKLTLLPPMEREKSGSALIDAWNEGERKLRFALGIVRAEKRNKTAPWEHPNVPDGLMQAVRTAVSMESPMEAEVFLNRYRLDFLETLRPADAFAEDTVFYYGLKLKLIQRIRQFDEAAGEAAYRTIYNSILHGERPEEVQ